MKSNKQLKEEFVQGLTGSSIQDVFLLLFTLATTLVISSSLYRRSNANSRLTPFASFSILIADFIISAGALTAGCTVYANRLLVLFNVTMAGALLALSTARGNGETNIANRKPSKDLKSKRKSSKPLKHTQEEEQQRPKKSGVIDVYRGFIMMITCFCILAVDFPIFHRKFAKVETWGFSLMDTGVAFFVFSMGISSYNTYVKKQTSWFYKGLWIRFITLCALGIVRFLLVKNLDYQEHVTEYGVHWNFFFTLAFITIAIPPLSWCVKQKFGNPLVVSLILSILQQTVLDSGALYWTLSERRQTLFQQNKEGIVSMLGYVAIVMYGMNAGSIVFKREDSDKSLPYRLITKKVSNKYLSDAFDLLITALISAIGFLILDRQDYLTSRRLVNIQYINIMSIINNSLIAYVNLIMYVTEKVYQQDNVILSKALEYFNRNGMLLFLFANMLTGLVNLNFDTLQMSNVSAVILISGYMLTLLLTSKLAVSRLSKN